MADAVIDKATIANSVTAPETKVAKQNLMWLGNYMLQGPLIPLLSELPAGPSKARDAILFSALGYEDKWANAVSMAVAKCASLDYDVEGEVPLRRKAVHDLLGNVNAMQGWTQFASQHVQDYLTSDNGAFIEIVRASSSIGSKIVGLVHLDSWRCYRTGDPAIPVIYRDKLGNIHPMKAHEVIALCDMPSPRVTFNGAGICAASRVYRTIYRMACVEAYVAEKVSGQRPLALHLVNGITDKQIEQIFKSAKHEADARGLVSFMGAAVSGVPTDEPISVVTIPFSELPDGFDLEKERSNARLEYTNALGLDIQDTQPGAIGGSLGSSTQSEVLNEKRKGKTLALWQRAFVEQINLKVAPDMTTMIFVEKDYRDEKMQSEAQGGRMDNVVKAKNAGLIDAKQGVKILIDSGDLPPDTVAPEPVAGVGPDGKPLPVAKVGGDAQPNVLGNNEKPQEAVKSQDEIMVEA